MVAEQSVVNGESAVTSVCGIADPPAVAAGVSRCSSYSACARKTVADY
jgi:hypothetical protein